MDALTEVWAANRDFLETGGWVLGVIGIVTFLMWTMIVERHWYLHTGHRERVDAAIAKWRARSERTSWYAHQIRRALVAQVSLEAGRTVRIIKTLVAICPLLGLLGTVTGMIEVFEVMAISGGGNARAMASGVSRATIPTMAGMVASIFGFIFSVHLERRVKHESEWVAEHLSPDLTPEHATAG